MSYAVRDPAVDALSATLVYLGTFITMYQKGKLQTPATATDLTNAAQATANVRNILNVYQGFAANGGTASTPAMLRDTALLGADLTVQALTIPPAAVTSAWITSLATILNNSNYSLPLVYPAA